MTLNGVIVVALRYFTEFGKPAFQITIFGGIYVKLSIEFYCVYSVVVKKVHVRYLISWWVSCFNYRLAIELIGKCTRCGLRISVNWTFLPGVTALHRDGSVSAKFSGRRGRGSPPLTLIDRRMNVLQLCRWRFHTKKLCSRLSSNEMRFYMQKGRFGFLSPLWGGARGNVRCLS